MLPAEKEQQLIARYGLIEDLQERLAAVMAFGRKQAPLTEPERSEERRVPGCTSRVWLVGEVVAGRCRFRLDADSALVKGLAAFLCEVYQDAQPEEAAAYESTVLEALHLAEQLSPTRWHGLRQVEKAIRDFAQAVA